MRSPTAERAPVYATARTLGQLAEDTDALHLDAPDARSFEALGRFSQLRSLTLSSAQLANDQLASLCALTSLRTLSLSSCTGAAAEGLARLLAAVPIERFSATWCRELGADAARVAASCATLRSFSYFGGPSLDDTHVTQLAALPALETLYVHTAGGVTDAGVSALTAAPALAHLTLYDAHELTGATLPSLVRLRSLSARGKRLDPRWPRALGPLRELTHLGAERLDADDIAALAKQHALTSLQLYAGHTMARDELRALAALSHLEQLRMSLSTALDDDALAHIAAGCPLRVLDIAQCNEVTGAAFADAARWASLESLDASHGVLHDHALAHLAALPRLERLVLHAMRNLTAAGFSHLVRAPALRSLDLYAPPLDDALFTPLAARLDELVLYGAHRVSSRAVRAAVAARPSLRVVGDGFLDAELGVAASERYPAEWNGAPYLSLDRTCIGLINHAGSVAALHRPSGAKRSKKPLRAPLVLAPSASSALHFGAKPKLVALPSGAALLCPAVKFRRTDAGAYSPDGSLLAVAGLGGTTKKPACALVVWRTGTDQIVAQVSVPGDSDDRLGVALDACNAEALLWGPSLERVVLATGAVTTLCADPVSAAVFSDDGGVVFARESTLVRLDAQGRERSRTDLDALLADAPGLTLRTAIDRIEANARPRLPQGDTRVEALSYGADGPVVLLCRGAFDLALVLGDRARWLGSDGVSSTCATLDPSSLALSYERPGASRSNVVAVWSLDALRELFADDPA